MGENSQKNKKIKSFSSISALGVVIGSAAVNDGVVFMMVMMMMVIVVMMVMVIGGDDGHGDRW